MTYTIEFEITDHKPMQRDTIYIIHNNITISQKYQARPQEINAGRIDVFLLSQKQSRNRSKKR